MVRLYVSAFRNPKNSQGIPSSHVHVVFQQSRQDAPRRPVTRKTNAPKDAVMMAWEKPLVGPLKGSIKGTRSSALDVDVDIP